MGFFDFLNNKKGIKPNISIDFTEEINGKSNNLTVENIVITPTDFEHLTKDGDLPYGWIYRNRDFINRVETEYGYFLDMWIDASNKSPRELYPALKSFVLYLEDIEKICKKKGECFTFWFYEILTSYDYLSKRRKELEELTANIDILQKEYEKRQFKKNKSELKSPK